MIDRQITPRLQKLVGSFKAIALTGPRQSGKTTLVKFLYPEKTYISLENPTQRNYALEDPQGFLSDLPDGAILDEVQRVPQLFSFLQEILDNSTTPGKFILTGSNNLLLQETISQTLAGRVAYLTLLPFSYSELIDQKGSQSDDELICTGFYPPVFDQKPDPAEWYSSYIRTYIERDVRLVRNITDLITFERFLHLLAGRTAQELNLTALSGDTGVDVKTIQSWISIMEASYIVFLLRPHHLNFNKTIVKRPKLYFFDPGIVCSLLGITQVDQLKYHPLKGHIFETMVIAEQIKKQSYNPDFGKLYFWRDKTGHEIDLLIDKTGSLYPVEIKSGQTINPGFFNNLLYYNRLSGSTGAALLYAGSETQNRSNGIKVVNWREFSG
jgi:predicted AAA+ superfamily ATPase